MTCQFNKFVNASSSDLEELDSESTLTDLNEDDDEMGPDLAPGSEAPEAQYTTQAGRIVHIRHSNGPSNSTSTIASSEGNIAMTDPVEGNDLDSSDSRTDEDNAGVSTSASSSDKTRRYFQLLSSPLSSLPSQVQNPPRVASPTPPLLSTRENHARPQMATTPYQLTFHVRPGHQRPITINLDLSRMPGSSLTPSLSLPDTRSLSHTILSPCPESTSSQYSFVSSTNSTNWQGTSPTQAGLSFNNLPPELRNKVYRMLFVDSGSIDFRTEVSDTSRSSNFLATCRQVHAEGRTVLYGENEFKFGRVPMKRGRYFDRFWTEIGYKDFHHFLKDIGTKNMSLIKTMTIIFEDSLPSSTPHMTHEDRRFINDDHLRSCLKLIVTHGELDKLSLTFLGRKMIFGDEFRFLSVLEQIKAKEIEVVDFKQDVPHPWTTPSKIRYWARYRLIEMMTRKTPEQAAAATAEAAKLEKRQKRKASKQHF
ncbi:MAG: hypothetical protein M1827_005616 [Pycnora praestabilis]|nr:MAG: hypothetical protein M1827_005616 [Pycnora praestabilis]